ncbi:MAG: alcohol dehydrogenase catalytic domain-containing protein [Candidatus Doudnabacteria bacterium]|nr:alcohol dehydrogenase catalytic domain-containing protein [Candidatus Doudnabacteria bacterium]
MKALIFDKSKTAWEESKGFELVDIPKPVLNKGDEDKIILKVRFAGVCGTDKGIWHRMAFKDAILNSIDHEATQIYELHANDANKKTYRVIGHEFFGEVIEKGSNVKDIEIGDMVSCESHVVCNKCFQCLNGQKEVCTNEKILGISVDGGFAEYAKVPAQVAWKTDVSKIRPEIAAMQEPFGNAVHAASKVDLKGKTVAIFGLGPIAQFLVLIAQGLGAKTIIGVEPNEKAAEMGKKMGIDHMIRIKNEELGIKNGPAHKHNQVVFNEIMQLTQGLGVDVAFEMAGFNDSVNNAISSVRRGGDVILFGLKTGDFMLEDYNKLIMKGVTLHCVAGRQIWQTWEITKKLLENTENKIQEKLWSVLLNEGEGTILNIADYSKENFEEMMTKNPKFLIKF